ncbi:MAG: hypothetical protein Tsb008_18470 [Rhodothalassiaceae bacterium]
MSRQHADLPPAIHLKMALDFLYARAMQLNLTDTALLIGAAAMSAESEGCAGREQKKQGSLPMRANG